MSKFTRLSEVELPSTAGDDKRPPDTVPPPPHPPFPSSYADLEPDDSSFLDDDDNAYGPDDSDSDDDLKSHRLYPPPPNPLPSHLPPSSSADVDTDDEAERVGTPFHEARIQGRVPSPPLTPSSSTAPSIVPSSVSLPFSSSRRRSSLLGVRASTIYYAVVIPLMLFFFLLLPFIMVLVFYLSFSEVFVSLLFAVTLPTLLYHLLWRRYLRANPTPFAASASVSERVWLFFLKVHRTWQQELYQLCLTLLSCATFILYTYHLSYVPSATVTSDYDYALDFSSSAVMTLDLFIQLEYFLIVSFSIDYLLGFFVAVHKWRYVLAYYSVIDLACFTGVSYFSFFHGNFAPKDALYNYYLLQGPLRFMRMRRALKGLDNYVQARGTSTSPVLYRWGDAALSKQSAMLALVSFRLFLYLLSTAALVLAVEFPCLYVAAQPARCTGELQRFHICVYFVVISISTVGYGDVVCVTDLGRMLMIFIVIGALVQVPAELDAWKEVQNADKAAKAAEAEEGRRRAQQQQVDAPLEGEKEATATMRVDELSVDERERWLRWCEQQMLLHHSEDSVRALCEAADVAYTTQQEVGDRSHHPTPICLSHHLPWLWCVCAVMCVGCAQSVGVFLRRLLAISDATSSGAFAPSRLLSARPPDTEATAMLRELLQWTRMQDGKSVVHAR